MPQIRFEPTNRTDPESNWLIKHARKNKSQLGQEGILDKIYEVMGHANKFCVEFGAWDGVNLSNTYEFLAEKDWSGVLIEGKGWRCKEIIQNHNNNPKLQVVQDFVGWEGESRLDAILDRCNAPLDFDLLSIDIDGNDYHVWQATEKYRPRVVLIEFNPSIPNDVFFVQDRDPSVNQGSSLRAMIALGKQKGYSLVCVHSWDAFFVPNEFYKLFNIRNNDIDAMYDQSPHATRFFHGYDSTLYTVGRSHSLWDPSLKFDHDKLQLRPKEQRSFGH